MSETALRPKADAVTTRLDVRCVASVSLRLRLAPAVDVAVDVAVAVAVVVVVVVVVAVVVVVGVALVLCVVTGSRSERIEPYDRDVRIPAAATVSVGRDIMLRTTLKLSGNRLVAIVTTNRVSAWRCLHAIRPSYRQ